MDNACGWKIFFEKKTRRCHDVGQAVDVSSEKVNI
jgi:hypothetical protein